MMSAPIKEPVAAITPPRQAHPVLPTLPALPEQVDPDAWVQGIDGCTYARRVKANGSVRVDGRGSSVKKALAGHLVTLRVNAEQRCFEVIQQEHVIKRLALKGLQGHVMPLEKYVALMEERARSEERQRRLEQRRRLLLAR
jgi:hypothetical protein